MTSTPLAPPAPPALASASDSARAEPPRKKRGRGALARRVLWITVAAGGLAALAYAWRPRPLAVEVTTATRGDLVVTVDEMAKTRVRDRYQVSSPMAANVLRIQLRAGDEVKAGTVLARLVPTPAPMLDPRARAQAQARVAGAAAAERQAKAAVARAEAAEAHATEDLDRTRRLVTAGSLASEALRDVELEARVRREEAVSARFGAQMAGYDWAMAGAALARFEGAKAGEGFDVTSPIDGRVLRVLQQSADVVGPGTPLLDLGDPRALEVVADVLTADAVHVRPGAAVTVERWGGDPLRALVRTVEPSATTRVSALGVEEQRVAVVMDLVDARERWAALGDGFRVEVRITVAERRAVVRIPLGATFKHKGAWAVYVVRGGRAVLTPVRLGARSDTDAEVEAGLEAGDVVVLHPGERIVDQARVEALGG